MVRPALLVLGAVVLVVAAYWAGTRFSTKEPAKEPAPPVARRVVERVVLAPATPRLTPEVREPVVEAAVAVEEPVRVPTEAIAIVEAGIRDGTWSAAERDTLRVHLVHLEPAEIDQVLKPLFQAINAQRVRLDGPPI
jgi:hypothetical protein